MDLRGYTETTVLSVAKKAIENIYHAEEELTEAGFDFELVEMVRHRIRRVQALRKDVEPVVLDPEPHRLDDVVDAAHNWAYLLESRLALYYNLDVISKPFGEEDTDEDFPGFPHRELKEAEGNRRALLSIWDILLDFAVRYQTDIMEYAQTVETLGEGIALRDLLETAVPLVDWLEYRDSNPPETFRYRVVQDLFDAVNILNRAARHSYKSVAFFHYPWTEFNATFLKYIKLN